MDFTTMLAYAPVASFVFLITIATSAYALTSDASILERFLLIPWRVIREREWYRVFTCALIHADWMHLIFNMITFYFFAPLLEVMLGHVGFMILYVGGMIGSHLPVVWRHRNQPNYGSLGASGAISAVVFSFILFEPFQELGVLFFIPMPAWLFAVVYLAFSYYADRQPARPGVLFGNVNHGAHLWGAIAGLILTPIIRPGVIIHILNALQG